MGNIFENAFFGKRYRTRDGHCAVYLFPYDCIIKTTHNLVVNAHYDDTHLCEIVTDDDGLVGSVESPFDIVSEWREPITDEELNKLAAEYSTQECYDLAEYCCEFNKDDLFWAYKAGYHKAMEE